MARIALTRSPFRPDRVDPIAVPGDDDDFGGRRSLHDVVQGFQPFLGPVLRGRKTEVQAHELRTVLVDRRQRRPAVLGEEQREVVAQRILQLRADGLIVVDNEKFRLIHHASGRGWANDAIGHGRIEPDGNNPKKYSMMRGSACTR